MLKKALQKKSRATHTDMCTHMYLYKAIFLHALQGKYHLKSIPVPYLNNKSFVL